MAGNSNEINPTPSTFSDDPAVGEVQGRRPVESVSWYEVIVFCNRLSMQESLTPAYSINGSTDPADWGTVPSDNDSIWDAVVIIEDSTGYRLPTEAQWEYAAKGGTPAALDWVEYTYSGSDMVDNVAWHLGNSNSITHEVGKKAPNGLGLYDMNGNVFEWCWDWYGDYTDYAKTDPTGASGTYRMRRGGSWGSEEQYLRSVYRYSIHAAWDSRDSIGFRLVRP